MLIGNSVTT